MNNIKLSNKLIILTIIMLLCAATIAWVGISRLSVLNETINELSTKTTKKLIFASEMQKNLLAAVRSQKNANLATTDEESKTFVDDYNRSIQAYLTQKGALEALMGSGQMSLKSIDATFVKFSADNKECLDLAVQNTIVKANAELFGKSSDAFNKAMTEVRNLTEKAKPTNTESAPTLLQLQATLQELSEQLYASQFVAARHIATPVDDEKFPEVDAKAKELQERNGKIMDKIAELCTANAIPLGELPNLVNEFRSSISRVVSLSTLDTNNKSVKISLGSAKKSTEDVMKALDDLVGELSSQTERELRASQDLYNNSFRIILGAAGLSLLLGVVASIWISRSITIPIAKVRNITQSMSTGDLTGRIEFDSKDEVGELASATDSLADSLSVIIQEIQKTSHVLADSSHELGSISSGLVSQSEESSMRSSGVAAASEELSVNINTMSAAAEQMSINFSSISSATEELSASVGAISSAAEQTSSNVTNVAAAVQEISKSFGDVLNDVKQGSQVAGQASQMAEHAGRTMQDLDKSSNEISKFTETIKMIALQTNLLALNATIEATSAGEAGKGFAVVAHEIKELANQSAKAAEDIAKKIEDVQGGSRQAVGVIREIAEVIKTINQSADRISHSVENQNRSAQTISQNVVEANKGVGHIARSISEVATTTNDMSRNISEASRGALDVSRNVGEAARAASDISESIGQVSAATRQTNASANSVTEAAKQLDTIARELRNLTAKFKISRHGN